MKKFIVLLAMVLFVYYSPCVFAAEHGGQEHGGQEHGGAAVAAQPSAKDIKSTMKNYVEEKSKQTGTFDVKNEGGKLSVVDVRIHKINGKPRYTYDKNDNRIPVKK